ncbi:hypothetical protein SISNIDRAFT_464041 [Sistotremastrum niveocremeum HHB9708]|uniref:Uncharacterized protein n=1 Tax=Sistotremastrum niveocremeum HHB9708 TaxID=1314777 RepID=A0A164Y4V1_9AGAM|nr:hypothetical protein SISNIDRAFT_464041 [Sistotremastrum niveocremeum HHB9708]
MTLKLSCGKKKLVKELCQIAPVVPKEGPQGRSDGEEKLPVTLPDVHKESSRACELEVMDEVAVEEDLGWIKTKGRTPTEGTSYNDEYYGQNRVITIVNKDPLTSHTGVTNSEQDVTNNEQPVTNMSKQSQTVSRGSQMLSKQSQTVSKGVWGMWGTVGKWIEYFNVRQEGAGKLTRIL